MLKKLLKYDLQNIFRFLVVFYGLTLFFGISTRFFSLFKNSFMMQVVYQISVTLVIALIINILINNLIRLWVRFKQNLYGDESYLTHTLPVSKKTIYLSKFLTSLISLFVSVIVILITLFIAFYSKENLEMLKNLLLSVASFYNSSVIGIILVFVLVFFLQLFCALQAGYAGIILGHKKDNNKMLFSVLFGIVTYIIIQAFALGGIFFIALFQPDIMILFLTNTVLSIDVLKLLMGIILIIYIVVLVINYFLNVNWFKKGVNVD